MTALDTDSFDIPFKLHELKDSRIVAASSQAVLADFRSQMLDRIRIRPDSARRLSTSLQPSLCARLVLNMLSLHLRDVFTLLSTFSGTCHLFVMDKTPDISIAMEAFQLRFRRFLGQSITEFRFSVTPP